MGIFPVSAQFALVAKCRLFLLIGFTIKANFSTLTNTAMCGDKQRGIIMNRKQKSQAVWTHETTSNDVFAEPVNYSNIDHYKHIASEVITGILFVGGVLAVLFLTGCSTPGTVYNQAPTQQLVLDKQVAGLSRNEIINGVTECEGAGLRAHVITTKRSVNGFTSDIPIEVTCMPKYRY